MTEPPEKPKFDPTSSKRTGPDISPSEGDFWDLDEEEEAALTGNAATRPAQEPTAAAEPSPSPPTPTAPKKEKVEAPTTPKKANQQSAPHGDANPTKDKNPGVSKGEMVALLTLGASLVAGVVWAFSLFFSEIPTESSEQQVTYPVTGTFTTIAAAPTYWRQPNPETDQGVRTNTRLIPATQLTLSPSNTSGALRITFENEAGETVGDSITVRVSNGQFSQTDTTTREVSATAGFNDEGDHAAYLTGQIDRWFLVIREGPDANASGKEFKELLRTPISNTRQ